MSTVTVSRKKRLNRDELDTAEKVLRKKYRHIVKGTLKNVSPQRIAQREAHRQNPVRNNWVR
ncbi:MAG: hypothetical protein JRD89_02100 [Deltaproteobacteria bacterium]|nr:hypothetical protein [Deltaproteobacteria bacterium]